MQNELLDLIDQIDDIQVTAECDVLTALSNTYQKALIISEQCDDTYVFNESLFMEAKDEKPEEKYVNEKGEKVDKPRPIRSQNIIAKLVRLIKRIWQRILTMVTAASTNAVVNKLKLQIKHASTDKVPSPYELRTLEFYIKFHDDLAEYNSRSFEMDPDSFVIKLKNAKSKIESFKQIVPEQRSEKLGTIEFVPKESMIKYLDSYQNYLDALKNCAKQIDKYLDKHYKTDGSTVQNYETLTDADKANGVTGRFTQSKLSDSDIQVLNNASAILFEQLRHEMELLKVKAQHITDQFDKVKQPGIDLLQDISMKTITNTVHKLLMGHNLNKSTKDYAVVVVDSASKDPESQKIIAAYKDILKPEPNYGNAIGVLLVNKNNGSVKGWRILKSDNVSDDVRKQLGDQGTFVVKN